MGVAEREAALEGLDRVAGRRGGAVRVEEPERPARGGRERGAGAGLREREVVEGRSGEDDGRADFDVVRDAEHLQVVDPDLAAVELLDAMQEAVRDGAEPEDAGAGDIEDRAALGDAGNNPVRDAERVGAEVEVRAGTGQRKSVVGREDRGGGKLLAGPGTAAAEKDGRVIVREAAAEDADLVDDGRGAGTGNDEAPEAGVVEEKLHRDAGGEGEGAAAEAVCGHVDGGGIGRSQEDRVAEAGDEGGRGGGNIEGNPRDACGGGAETALEGDGNGVRAGGERNVRIPRGGAGRGRGERVGAEGEGDARRGERGTFEAGGREHRGNGGGNGVADERLREDPVLEAVAVFVRPAGRLEGGFVEADAKGGVDAVPDEAEAVRPGREEREGEADEGGFGAGRVVEERDAEEIVARIGVEARTGGERGGRRDGVPEVRGGDAKEALGGVRGRKEPVHVAAAPREKGISFRRPDIGAVDGLRGGKRRVGAPFGLEVGVRRIGAEAVQLVVVGEAVAVGVADVRIRPRAVFLEVRQAVAVRVKRSVIERGVEAVCEFPAVGHPVAVGVREERIRAGEELGEVGESVGVGVERGVGGILGVEAVERFPPVGRAVVVRVRIADEVPDVVRRDDLEGEVGTGPEQLQAAAPAFVEVADLDAVEAVRQANRREAGLAAVDAVVVDEEHAVERNEGAVVRLDAEFVVRRGRCEEVEDVARREAVAARHLDAGPRGGVRVVQGVFDLLEVRGEIREVGDGGEGRGELVVGGEETGRVSGIRRTRPVGPVPASAALSADDGELSPSEASRIDRTTSEGS